MALNVSALKSAVTDTLLIQHPSILKAYDYATTSIYTNPSQPHAILQVADLQGAKGVIDPTSYVTGATGVGALDVKMSLVQAKRKLTFDQIQGGLTPESIVAGLMVDLEKGIFQKFMDSILGKGTTNPAWITEVAYAADSNHFAKLWAAVKGTNKVCIFGSDLLGEIQLNTSLQHYKMQADNRMEPGFGGFALAQYVDDLSTYADAQPATTVDTGFAWSKTGVGMAFAPVKPIGDDREISVAGAGLPSLYSRISVNEDTREVVVTLEVLVGAGASPNSSVAYVAAAPMP